MGCFASARANRWLVEVEKVGWGLHLPAGKPNYVGVARDHDTKVFVAKFTAVLHPAAPDPRMDETGVLCSA